MTDNKPIGLGDRVKDTVTGLQGIVVCVTTWLHGCIRYGVQPEEVTKEGKAAEPMYFDQTQVKLVKAAVHTPQVLEVAVQQPEMPKRRSAGGPSRESAGFQR